ncbi:uncharacterized protein jus isoform X1 [Drosophila bipectinata]|uniref:uncharacterized protein jus isoform X1 n=1 Tax=Drosophila bipectinata TaxID=42026 RepID=UPI0038B3E06C
MRLDGALEPRPRYGAAPFKGRFPLRRETREQCESQQQQSADEDDEATDAECLTNDNNNNTIHSRNNINNWPANRANLNLQPATLRTTKQSRAAGSGAGNLKRCSMVATLKTRAPPSLMLMGQKDLHPGSRKARMKAAGSKGARAGRGGAGARAGTGSRSGWERLNSSLVLLLISVIALMPPLTLGDDGDNFFAVNAFSAGPETTTPEFDYASRGQKKFGDKCENTLECGFPGSICDPKKKSCQCTEDLPVTNHIDKCGKEAAVNESCFFNEQCEMKYFQTECRDGRCICRFEMSPIWGKDGSVECKGRQDKRGAEEYIDPAMIGVLVGMALMFIIICVVLRLFSQARWRENRTIFNTPNPRLMNVSLLRDSKLLHGQERRGSRMSVRAPSRQPSMASLRPHSPNPSLGKTGSHSESHGSASNASATSVRSNRSNSVAPGKVAHHERHGSAHRQHHQHGGHHQQQQSHPQSPQDQSLVTNITTNPVAESVTVEIIEPGQK